MKRTYALLHKNTPEGYKTCLECETLKLLEYFNEDKTGKFGKRANCRECDSKKRKLKWKQDAKFREQWLLKTSEWRLNNKQYYVKYQKNLRKNNPNQKIKEGFYSLINYHLNKISTSKTDKLKYLMINIEDYKKYLEDKFEPGMNWENKGDVWEIDHIIPLSSFNLTVEENLYKAFSYNNTQPLFKTTKIAEKHGSISIGNKNKHKNIL
jgi:hypothetical protein